jgi:hypothetical protein
MIGGQGNDTFVFKVHAEGANISWVDSLGIVSEDCVVDPEAGDILRFNVDLGGVNTAAELDDYVFVVDDGTDVTIFFNRDGDGSWTGDAEDSIVLKGMGIAPGAAGIDSLVELSGSINILVV